MNELTKKWLVAKTNNLVWTKHNELDVYNSIEIKNKLIQEYKYDYFTREKEEFDIIYKEANDLIKAEMDKELNDYLDKKGWNIIMKKIKSINKLKGTAFEKFFNYNSNYKTETTIFKINEIIKQNNKLKDYFVFNYEIEIYDKSIKDLISFRKFGNNYIFGILKNENTNVNKYLIKKYYAENPYLKKEFIYDENKHILRIKHNCPIISINKKRQYYFYLSELLQEHRGERFEEFLKESYFNENINLSTLKIINNYFLYIDFKSLLQNYHKKSPNFKELKSKTELNNFKLNSLVETNLDYSRVDLWEENKENKTIKVIELKNHEYTEIDLNLIKRILRTCNLFNQISIKEKLEYKINELLFIHTKEKLDVLSINTLKDLIKIAKNNGIDLQIKNISELTNIKKKIKIEKVNNKYNYYFLNNDEDNLVIDLTNIKYNENGDSI